MRALPHAARGGEAWFAQLDSSGRGRCPRHEGFCSQRTSRGTLNSQQWQCNVRRAWGTPAGRGETVHFVDSKGLLSVFCVVAEAADSHCGCQTTTGQGNAIFDRHALMAVSVLVCCSMLQQWTHSLLQTWTSVIILLQWEALKQHAHFTIPLPNQMLCLHATESGSLLGIIFD